MFLKVPEGFQRKKFLSCTETLLLPTLSNQSYFQVPGDYYDSIELGEEGDMDYTYDDNGYVIPV